jgi:hypothetical protein
MRLPSEVTVAVVLALALALSRRTQDERRTGRRQEFQESATSCPPEMSFSCVSQAVADSADPTGVAPMRTIGQSTKMRT